VNGWADGGVVGVVSITHAPRVTTRLNKSRGLIVEMASVLLLKASHTLPALAAAGSRDRTRPR
jgi:hypothetical protein